MRVPTPVYFKHISARSVSHCIKLPELQRPLGGWLAMTVSEGQEVLQCPLSQVVGMKVRVVYAWPAQLCPSFLQSLQWIPAPSATRQRDQESRSPWRG